MEPEITKMIQGGEEWYYLEVGKAELYRFAHHNSMCHNHYICGGPLEELAWDLLLLNDPVNTIWGDF